MNTRCASLNSGVAKERRGSSFCRISSSCSPVVARAVGRVCQRAVPPQPGRHGHDASPASLALLPCRPHLLDVLPHLLKQRLGVPVVGVRPLLKLPLHKPGQR